MFKLKKIRIGIHFSGVIVIFLTVSMVIIAIVALISLRNLDNYTVSKLEGNIKQHTADLFSEATRKKADEYSNIFNKASDLVNVLSDQAVLNISNLKNYNFEQNRIEAYCREFESNGKNAPLINSTLSNVLAVYTGKEKNIPLKSQKKLYSFSFLNPLLKQVYLANPNYSSSWFWFCDDSFIKVYSRNSKFINILSTNTGYKKFIEQLEAFSSRDGVSKVELTDNYKNIAGESVLSAVYRYYNDIGKLIFMAGIDLKLDELENDIIHNRIPILGYDRLNKNNQANSFAFIVSYKSRRVILSSNDVYNKNGNKLHQNEKDTEQQSKSNLIVSMPSPVKEYIYDRLKDDSGLFSFVMNDETYLLTYSKILANDWYLGVAVLQKNYLAAIRQSGMRINKGFIVFELNFILAFVFLLLLTILILIVFFRKYIIKPISKLRNDVFKMGRGNFDLTINPIGVSEIGDLGESFNALGHKVDKYIRELKQEVTVRNRREKEMQIAKRIQQSILPRVTSVFSSSKIRLFARLHPAKNVAGDFYDFFFLTRKRLVLLIADVSGKGVSAAFYMTIAKRTIRNACINEPDDPAKALRLSNELLCEYNLKMFVSVFLVYYDLDTGFFHYGNAGHNEPVMLKNDGESKFFGSHHDMVLGIFPDLKFHTGEEPFVNGDTLVLYTDGITEANASSEDYFGEERLLKYLDEHRALSAKNLCRSLIAHVHNFENGTQYDDMTVLTFRRKK